MQESREELTPTLRQRNERVPGLPQMWVLLFTVGTLLKIM